MIRYPAVVKPRRTIKLQKNRKSVFEDAIRDNPWMVEVSKKNLNSLMQAMSCNSDLLTKNVKIHGVVLCYACCPVNMITSQNSRASTLCKHFS